MVATIKPEATNISAIIAKIAEEAGPLGKERNDALKFAFRGVDATINHLSPLLNRYGVVVTPDVQEYKIEMHAVKDRFLTEATVKVQYIFTAPDGSVLGATTLGFATDFADRAATQAQSVAFRIALLQVFHLPTDEVEPEVRGAEVEKILAEQAKKPAVTAAASPANAAADSIDSIRADIKAIIEGSYADKNTGELLPAFPGGGAAVNKLANELTGKAPAAWGQSVTDLKKIRAALLK